MSGHDVVGLGVATIDIVMLVDHLPAEEEIERALDLTLQGGGPVATAIVTLARLGARTAMLDAIGDDWRGKLILEDFAAEGVEMAYLARRMGCTTATACLLVRRETGSRTIVFLPGTTPDLTPEELPRQVIEGARFLHLNGRHLEACLQACRWGKQAGVQVSFDGGARRYRPEMRQLVPLSDICIVAGDFAEKYTQESGLEAEARALLAEGPRLVAITDGIRGSWVFPRQGPSFHQPAFRVPNVVDTTGCGDAYHGAFLFGLLKGMDLEKTAALASATAALNAQHLGGRRGLPTLLAVEDFLQAYQANG